jgi:hypothetical protein
MLASQLLVCYCVILKTEGRITFLPPWIVGQQLASGSHTMLWALIEATCELLKLDNWEPNKLQAWPQSKGKPASSKVVTSFRIKTIPFWMNHTIGTKGLATIYFHVSHQHNNSNHRNKTNAYGAPMIRYEIVPRFLNNMD